MSSETEESLFKFWEGVSPSTKVHPKDATVFEENGKHNFKLDCLPNPYYGPLKTAPIVLLYLNPGFSDKDYAESQTEEGGQFYWRQRQGNEPLRSQINLKDKSWWVSRTKHLNSDPEYLRHKLAVLELCAYHSKSFSDGAMLSKLPSCQVAMNWAVSHLFVQARARKRVVICMRATKRWGLTSGNHDGWLFAPRVTRGGHMFNDENRQLIVDAAKDALTMPNER